MHAQHVAHETQSSYRTEVINVPGASEQTSQVKVVNANWVAGPDGGDGRFEVMIVTADGHQHTINPSPGSMTALLALAKADTILLWDPTNRTLIAANVIGTWLAPTGLARAGHLS
jgi:hypothetical protein